jgi:hypothetical protein
MQVLARIVASGSRAHRLADREVGAGVADSSGRALVVPGLFKRSGTCALPSAEPLAALQRLYAPEPEGAWVEDALARALTLTLRRHHVSDVAGGNSITAG